MFAGSSPITFTLPSSKAYQKSGSFPPPALPGIRSTMTLSDSRPNRHPNRAVEAAALVQDGSPPITRNTFPTCHAHYPGGPRWVHVSVASPSRAAFPDIQAGRRPRLHFRGLLRLHSRYGPPDRSAAHRRPLSRGSNPCGYPHEPLVSYRINRQLSGWIPPPLMIRAFGAHCHNQTHAPQK